MPEYFDLLRAVAHLSDGDGAKQKELLKRLHGFVYDKHPTESRD